MQPPAAISIANLHPLPYGLGRGYAALHNPVALASLKAEALLWLMDLGEGL